MVRYLSIAIERSPRPLFQCFDDGKMTQRKRVCVGKQEYFNLFVIVKHPIHPVTVIESVNPMLQNWHAEVLEHSTLGGEHPGIDVVP